MKKMILMLLPILFSVPSAQALERASINTIQATGGVFCGGDGDICTVLTGLSSGITFSPILAVYTVGQQTFNMSAGNMKVIIAAKDDANYFVATNGEVVTARLINAVKAFRQDNVDSALSDVEIAELFAAF
jgi:uncharacterized protein (TIGR02448 family)